MWSREVCLLLFVHSSEECVVSRGVHSSEECVVSRGVHYMQGLAKQFHLC